MKFQSPTLCAGIVFLLMLLPVRTGAEFLNNALSSPSEAEIGADDSKIPTLIGILQSIDAIQKQLKSKQTELKAAASEDQKSDILKDVKELRMQLDTLGRNLEGIATGVNIDAFASPQQESFDWKQELLDIITPIVQELKNMTARPREIEKLRNEVSYSEKRSEIARNAVQNIGQLVSQTNDAKLKGKLTELQRAWKDQEQQLANQLAVARYQLNEKLNEEQSFFVSMHRILRMFFRSRGRSFILASFAFISVVILLRLFRQYTHKLVPSLKSSKQSFYFRLADVIYQLSIFAWAALASLIVLYVLGDWTLLGLAILFLIGLAWAAKHSAPKFLQQFQMLLNLGTVRENERLIYNGLPWRVSSLNPYTQLTNPELTGGTISLPLGKLVGMHSRPFQPHEPWFPCKEKDWVILSDETRGRVLFQSPEFVQLVLLGGSRKTYPTEEFLKQNPKNISTNFRIGVTFGVDYRHQASVTREIPEKMRSILAEGLEKEGFAEQLLSLRVEFKEAAASSLDLLILADFDGEAAKHYEYLSRTIQRLAVEACNKYGWVIPFTQITVHTPEG